MLRQLSFSDLPKYKLIKLSNVLKSFPPAVWIDLLLIIIFSIRINNFLSVSNLMSILTQLTPLLIISCGQTLIVLIQGTDLSLGASLNLISVLWILLMKNGTPLILAMILAISTAVLAGFLNGVIVSKLKLPIFIATLGMANILNSIALTISNGSSIYFQEEIYRKVTKGNFLGIPFIVWVGIACVLITFLILEKTRFGARVRSLGGNPEALTLAGFKTDRATIEIFTLTGLLAGIAGIMLACRIESGNPIAGNGFEFNSVAAVLLGGTSMREGRGGVIGTIFGVLLIQVLKNGLVMTNISSIYQSAIIGAVVLFAIIIDAFVRRSQ
jgi:ribose transport system permease protein